VECKIDDLPPAKKQLYNFQRNSKAFLKALN
jgi:amino-acid N-acetyltransferase